jgi:secondary thiamine-phosphate synthase enzyme
MAMSLFVSERQSSNFKVCHDLVDLRTQDRLQFIDITVLVAERVRRSGVTHGVVNIQTRHTTTAVLVNENEPLLIEDLKQLLERWAPSDGRYRHDDLEARQAPFLPDERPNGDSHARAVMLGPSESLNILDGKIQLGRWQRIFLVELDGSRKRTVSLTVMGIGDESVPRQGTFGRVRHGELQGVS